MTRRRPAPLLLLTLFAALAIAACASPRVSDLPSPTPADAQPTPSDTPGEQTPSGNPACSRTNTVVAYTGRDGLLLAQKLAAHGDPCTQYYLSLPAVECVPNMKICPRGPAAAAAIRALGPNFHPMAEFHWGSWRRWLDAHPGKTWFDAGVEFRKLMTQYGYDVAKGDTWAVNEFPSTVRAGTMGARSHARAATMGLYYGPGSQSAKGVVYSEGMGQKLRYTVVYKHNLESFLQDDAFWNTMSHYVRFWAQEMYAAPSTDCVSMTTVASRRAHVNRYAEHEAWLAHAGGARTAVAYAYLRKAFVPLLNATWHSDVYDSQIPAVQFQKFVSLEVYGTRTWASNNAYPGNRIGFGWEPYNRLGQASFDAAVTSIANRLATSVHDAYAPGAPAASACSADGSLDGCACAVSGASFNPSWDSFGSW